MKKLVLTLLLGITFGTIYGQGTLCSNAISLPCGTTNFSGTTVGAANNSVAGNCGSDFGQWYSFTGDGTVTTISCTTSGFDPAMQTYSGPCGSLVSVSCVDGAGATGTETYTFTTVLGTEYHVFISYYNQYAPNNSYSGTFRMSRTCPVAPCSPVFTATNGGNNCPANEFYINVNITNLGSAATVEISNNGGIPATTGVNSTGNQIIGPFPSGTIVNVVVENEAINSCTANANVLTPSCVPCDYAQPFCSDIVYNFPTSVSVADAVAGPDYGCLGTQPNPVYYYMRIKDAGDLNLRIESSCGDVDYAAWGPFSSTTCTNANLSTSGAFVYDVYGAQTVWRVDNFTIPSGNMVDCAYSTAAIENLYIPSGVVGDYYMVMITNYANCAGSYTFSKTSGTGSTDCGIVLGVELTQFDVKCGNSRPTLSWTTGSESNNDFFTIERSLDATNFKPIGTVKGNGNSSKSIQYSWRDPDFINETCYYRLKQTDFDGAIMHHEIKAAECNQTDAITIYPNPFERNFTVNVPENVTHPVTVEVMDNLGRNIFTQQLENKETKLTLDDRFPIGVYFIKVYNESIHVIEQIIKKK